MNTYEKPKLELIRTHTSGHLLNSSMTSGGDETFNVNDWSGADDWTI